MFILPLNSSLCRKIPAQEWAGLFFKYAGKNEKKRQEIEKKSRMDVKNNLY